METEVKRQGDKVLLRARGIGKRWPGVVALDKVDFTIYGGCVHAVAGENGAGKSTLMNIISGAYPDYEGELLMADERVTFRNTAEAAQRGISMIHQELNLIPYLSIAENIYLGHEPTDRWGMIDYHRMHREAAALLATLHFAVDTHTPVNRLRVGEQQLVEIAKALSYEVKVLIMDEPTSSLSENETTVLFERIERLTAVGVGVVYITHKMNEIERLADYITVLRDGRLIGEYRAAEVTIDEVIRLMVGRDRKDFFVKAEHSMGEVALEVTHLSLRDGADKRRYKVHDVSLTVSVGEVLGIYGLMGAGRSEFFEALFGVQAGLTTGSIRLFGREIEVRSPADAIRHGLALIPEDRKCDGLVLGMDIGGNISLAALQRVLKFGLLNRSHEADIAEGYRRRLSIKSGSCRQLAGNLSGGNQQKVVLSKWLLTAPKVLLLDEPTRGIDINAKNELYKLIDELAVQGMAVIVVSSELPEIMAISDRIVTLSGGRLTGEFARHAFSEEGILKAALP
jgi:ribose transport system ATP-binding protein